MAVHSKNMSFAEEMKQNISASVQNTASIASETMSSSPVAENLVIARSDVKPSTVTPVVTQTVTSRQTEEPSAKKRVLIGVYVTPEEQSELRQMFCSNGFALSQAYRSAMTYLRQDIELGKAFITKNGEILRK